MALALGTWSPPLGRRYRRHAGARPNGSDLVNGPANLATSLPPPMFIGQRPPQTRPSPSRRAGSAFAQGPAAAKKITNDEPEGFGCRLARRLKREVQSWNTIREAAIIARRASWLFRIEPAWRITSPHESIDGVVGMQVGASCPSHLLASVLTRGQGPGCHQRVGAGYR
jgi:hypothetical protein